jgi:hypothetical protein
VSTISRLIVFEHPPPSPAQLVQVSRRKWRYNVGHLYLQGRRAPMSAPGLSCRKLLTDHIPMTPYDLTPIHHHNVSSPGSDPGILHALNTLVARAPLFGCKSPHWMMQRRVSASLLSRTPSSASFPCRSFCPVGSFLRQPNRFAMCSSAFSNCC